MPGEGRYRDEYLYAADTLSRAGYRHYEVSNFALPGFASRHNLACWRGEPYLGLGNGAHSHHRGRRWWNERDWAAYAESITRSGRARAGGEVPTAEQSRLESLWLGLRTAEGLEERWLGGPAQPVLRSWETAGRAVRSGGRTRLTPEGWLLLDELTVELESALAAAGHGPPGVSVQEASLGGARFSPRGGTSRPRGHPPHRPERLTSRREMGFSTCGGS